MTNRRDFPHDHFDRGRDDSRSFSREQHRGGQYGGAYSGSMNYGNPYEPRRQSDRSRQSQWDEDRFGYPESGRHGRETGRGPNPGYGLQGRFGEDRYSWGQQYGGQPDMGRSLPPQAAYEPPRHFEPRRSSSSWDSSWGQGSSSGDSGESFAGGRSSYGDDQGGVFGGWGIPSGSELGGYGMNSPNRGDGPHNWSGSNWGNQGGREWGGGHSSRFGSEPGLRGRPPKGYTRSDDRIRDDVCEQLYRTPDVDVGDVTVETRNGTVILEGTVPDRRMKHRIEDLCEQCIGVQDVDNRIRVQREDRWSGEERPLSSSGTTGTTERSNRKSSTGTSSSQH